ncbi:unnamed protein product [Phytophthora fragariaefolia]|uniref:Unnamed protein product n=1 Tax=Phytophthora fragariaefolia TaxID=1490495 RepID=A0A9W7D174_9STRA|nr:unnamed protein product [Phytophthora fragariaefolia]
MRSENRTPASKIEVHKTQGREFERRYNSMRHLATAIDIVDMLAHELESRKQWKQCDNKECVIYRTTKWSSMQPFEEKFDSLPPKRLWKYNGDTEWLDKFASSPP